MRSFSREDREGREEDQIHVYLWPDWRFAMVSGRARRPLAQGARQALAHVKPGRVTFQLEPANALCRKHVPDA